PDPKLNSKAYNKSIRKLYSTVELRQYIGKTPVLHTTLPERSTGGTALQLLEKLHHKSRGGIHPVIDKTLELVQAASPYQR
ncbi:hypothetical protein Ciccas_012424, partial [Cichlidogyrus casuarinus]